MFMRKHIGLNHLPQVAKELIARFPLSKVFAFYGKMGSGKTTLIQEICRSLKSSDRVTSPTFAIVNEYFSSTGEAIYHFDFYRLNYFFSGNYCLIEWPEKIESLLPGEHIKVIVSEEETGLREITACIQKQEF
jgi:tRNA threonylcarbamoyladenosine biosynthesis protein TsaE